MKIDQYTTATFEAGDYLLGVKSGGPRYVRLFGNIQSTDSATITISTIQVTMTVDEIRAANPDFDHAFKLFSIPDGYQGMQLVYPPVLKTFKDGQNFVFSSGEDVVISASDPSLLDISVMSRFSDVIVTAGDGYYSGSFFNAYKIYGDVYMYSTAPITGGGNNATFTFILSYRLF